MITTVLLGAGNVATHLYKAFEASSQVTVIQVYNRSEKALESFPSSIEKTTSLTHIKDADLYIIALADDAISSFSESLPFSNKLVVHTSGSVAMEAISDKNRKGIFYPLQTFSKNSDVDFSEIPICIEAEKIKDMVLLTKLGRTISTKVQEISSKERAQLHLSAVFVNNFSNFMYQIGSDLLSKKSLSFDLLKPLIKETANKIETLTPTEAQTGPAKRNDVKTIENHLHLLKDSPYKGLYEELTKAIRDKHTN